MNIDATLQKFERFGVRLGLESIQQLLADLGNPQDRVPMVHVAGSNGKGSVCAYLSAVLTEAGYRVGRYTSPHLVSWCERICLNEQPITPAVLQAVLEQVIAAIRPDEPCPTQFEVITAAAWLYFAQQQVDIAVIEVGLGGRLDATNVSDRPLVSIITSLSLEHWQRLGPTLADIAGEKAGILKPLRPAVIGQIPSEAKAVVDRRIAELDCPAVYPEPAQDLGQGWADYHPLDERLGSPIKYRLPLQGAIQLQNSALAIAALHSLRQQGWQVSDTAIINGIAKTRWPARLQWYTWRDRQILIDGAHNPASAEVLRQFVDSLTDNSSVDRRPPTYWVMGMLSTKDHADVFQALLRPGDRLYLVPVPDHSSADPAELATLAQQICPELAAVGVYREVIAALEAAATAALPTQTTDRADHESWEQDQPESGKPLVVLCGSLYLIGHFLGATIAA